MAKLSDILTAQLRISDKRTALFKQLLEILKDDEDFEVLHIHDSIIIKTVYHKGV